MKMRNKTFKVWINYSIPRSLVFSLTFINFIKFVKLDFLCHLHN